MARVTVADSKGIWDELKTATDRAAVILAATFVEEVIFEAIIDSLLIADKKSIEELTGNNGPLGTFSNKVMFAHALGLIGEEARSDLNIIRKIRNKAAHQMDPFSLSDQQMKDLTGNFTVRYYGIFPFEKKTLPDSPRDRYIETCEKIAMRLENSEPLFSGSKREPEVD